MDHGIVVMLLPAALLKSSGDFVLRTGR